MVITDSLEKSPSSVSIVASTIWVLFASLEALTLSSTCFWIKLNTRVPSSSSVSVCLPLPFFVGVSGEPDRSCISTSTDEAIFCWCGQMGLGYLCNLTGHVTQRFRDNCVVLKKVQFALQRKIGEGKLEYLPERNSCSCITLGTITYDGRVLT